MKTLTYVEKLVHSIAIVVADATGATVEHDELMLAIIFVRNHLTAVVHRESEVVEATK